MTGDAKTKDMAAAGIDRRELLVGGAGTIGLFVLGFLARSGEAGELLRPPGAADAQQFQALCIKCDRCRSVCPQHCISTARLSDGFLQARTPVMDFHQGWCTFCMKCTAVCPTGALKPLKPAALGHKPEAIGLAEITEKCIALRTGGCSKCFEICHEKAITLTRDHVPQIIAERCTGCGRCVDICPANVLRSFTGSSERGVEVRRQRVEG